MTIPLPQALDALALEAQRVRPLPIRVERADGVMIEGLWDQRKDTGLSVLDDRTQSIQLIPLESVRRVWVPAVVGRRHQVYLGACVLGGVLVAAVSTRLSGVTSWLPGGLLGVAVVLAGLLAGWLPPVHNWIVKWELRYPSIL